jgi:hypothetical protein
MGNTQKSALTIPALVVLFSMLTVSNLSAQAPTPPQRPPQQLPPIPLVTDTTHTLSQHFTPASASKKTPDAKGFIQRWMVLEPVKKDIARNSIFTDSYLRSTTAKDNFSNDYAVVPKNGEVSKIGSQELKWHALDSKAFNFNLYHFTYALNQPRYGILVWLVTVVDCPEEIKNVRMAAGCNSGSMWWLNGAEALVLSGDRDLIVDNVMSDRLTLKKGRNIIRGAVLNGPGMCNFCIRFLDEKGSPVKNVNLSYQ